MKADIEAMKILVLLVLASTPFLASAQRRRRPKLTKSTDILVPVIEGEIGKTYNQNVTADKSELHYVFMIQNMGMNYTSSFVLVQLNLRNLQIRTLRRSDSRRK